MNPSFQPALKPSPQNGAAPAAGQQPYAPSSAALVPRYDTGWRAGKPAEDPEKMKRWGRIGARPSEYLIHMRRGKVLAGSSGQGASCFKWPWDAVAVVPTTVQELRFRADQITAEKVGVEVTGLAVYRIAEPHIAFRMLNFSYAERASEKLASLLVEMFAGAARRLVANLTVEECLGRRKEGIAGELMREIAPIVSGSGRLDDETDRGWGVVLDSIEIQDVRVLSPGVFSNLQARYRKELERQAREATLATERAIQQGEAEASRLIELTRLAAETEVTERRRAAQEHARLGELATSVRVAEAELARERASAQGKLDAERELGLAKLLSEAELRQRRLAAEEQARLEQIAAELRLAEVRVANERRLVALRLDAEVEKAQLEAEAEGARHAAQLAALAQEEERLRARAAAAEARRALAEAELAVADLDARKAALPQELELARVRALRSIDNAISAEMVQLTVAQKLPELAAAFQQNMGQVHVTAVDGANPFGYIAAAVEGVLGLARSAGLSLPRAEPQG